MYSVYFKNGWAKRHPQFVNRQSSIVIPCSFTRAAPLAASGQSDRKRNFFNFISVDYWVWERFSTANKIEKKHHLIVAGSHSHHALLQPLIIIKLFVVSHEVSGYASRRLTLETWHLKSQSNSQIKRWRWNTAIHYKTGPFFYWHCWMVTGIS